MQTVTHVTHERLSATDIDEAAATLRFPRVTDPFVDEEPTDPDATSIYDLQPTPDPRYVGTADAPSLARNRARRRRLIHATRQDIAGLRDAIEDGWDVGLELEHEERRLAALVAADRRR